MNDELRILPGVPLPDDVLIAEAQAEDYRRMRADITGRGQTQPTPLRDAMLGLGDEEVVRTVDPRSRRQQRYTHTEKQAYAAYLRDHMTPAEWKLWEELRSLTAQGIRFDPQALVHGWIVDFYCEALKLVIEVDGGVHTSNVQWQKDQHRDTILKRDGYTVLRYKNEFVLVNVARVTAKVLDVIAQMESSDAG